MESWVQRLGSEENRKNSFFSEKTWNLNPNSFFLAKLKFHRCITAMLYHPADNHHCLLWRWPKYIIHSSALNKTLVLTMVDLSKQCRGKCCSHHFNNRQFWFCLVYAHLKTQTLPRWCGIRQGLDLVPQMCFYSLLFLCALVLFWDFSLLNL